MLIYKKAESLEKGKVYFLHFTKTNLMIQATYCSSCEDGEHWWEFIHRIEIPDSISNSKKEVGKWLREKNGDREILELVDLNISELLSEYKKSERIKQEEEELTI